MRSLLTRDPNVPADALAPAHGALHIRPGGPDDLEALVALEDATFATDRLSRRSFRRFLASKKDDVIVADLDGEIVAYALVLFRSGTALARLYSIAVAKHAGRRKIGAMLLAAAEQAAMNRDCIVLRLEVREDNEPAIALYKKAGYRLFARHPDYYQDHGSALRFEKRLTPTLKRPGIAPPYFAQTADFTCGAACMMMALAWADPTFRPGQELEFKLWREATTIFMTSGHGGCGPFGIAVALRRRGLFPEVHVSHVGPYFTEGVRSEAKRRVMRLTQEGFREEAEDLRVPIHLAPLSESALMEALDGGAIAIMLVSSYRMFGRKEPHWVLVHGHDGRHIFVHDPWFEDSDYETATAAQSLPIPLREFSRMTRFGRDNLRAAVLIRKGPPA